MIKKKKFRREWSLAIDDNVWKEIEMTPEDFSAHNLLK